jgi:hypothetical protein
MTSLIESEPATREPLPVIHLLGQVMEEVRAVGKTGWNPDQKYNFRGVDAVVNAVGPVFRKFGIVPAPRLKRIGYRDVRTSRDKPAREVTVVVEYRFYGPAGDYFTVEVPGESMDSSDKGAAKAMSVAYRIALLQVLCLPTDTPDTDAEYHERGDANGQQEESDDLEAGRWLAQQVDVLLAVDDPERIEAFIGKIAGHSWAQRPVVARLVGKDDKAALGIGSDQDLNLVEFAALVQGFVEAKSHAVHGAST